MDEKKMEFIPLSDEEVSEVTGGSRAFSDSKPEQKVMCPKCGGSLVRLTSSTPDFSMYHCSACGVSYKTPTRR